MCGFYNVSRSGYYDWLKREYKDGSDLQLRALIEECHKQNKYRYGYRRIQQWINNNYNIIVNHKRVLRVMNKYNMLSVIRRHRYNKYISKSIFKYNNILDRDFNTNEPNQKWVTDITHIITPKGTLFLSAIRDLYDNYIVAYKTAISQDYSLVDRTLRAAIVAENISHTVLLHSDQGSQYTSFEYKKFTSENNIIPSMSHPGTPVDNSPAENFFSIFKTECIYIEKPQNINDAQIIADEFIHYYNYERIQINTGMTPYEKRCIWFNDNPKVC